MILKMLVLFSFLSLALSSPKDIDFAIFGNNILVGGEKGTEYFRDKYVLVKEDKIAHIITEKELSQFKVKEVIRYKKPTVILPGFANTHSHLPMFPLRGKFGNLNIKKWWEKEMKPFEDKNINKEFVSQNSLLGIKESLAGGVTLTNEMFVFSENIAESVAKNPIRALIGETLYKKRGAQFPSFERGIEITQSLVRKYKGSKKIKVATATQGVFSLSNNQLSALFKTAQTLNTPIHIHFKETEFTQKILEKRSQLDAIDALRGLGYSKDTKMIMAHGVFLSEKDIRFIKQSNTSVSINLTSNLLLGTQMPPLKKLVENKVLWGIGLDSVASNPNFDMRDEIFSLFLNYRKLASDDHEKFSHLLLKAATFNGYKMLGFVDGGRVSPGAEADLQVYVYNNNKTHISSTEFVTQKKLFDLKKLFILGKPVTL